jgi:hypothetical protein
MDLCFLFSLYRFMKLPTQLRLAEVKNEWSYTSAPTYAFMAWRGAALAFNIQGQHCDEKSYGLSCDSVLCD